MSLGTHHGHITIEVGGVAVGIHADDDAFLRVLEDRYADFIGTTAAPDYEFVIDLVPSGASAGDEDVRVFREGRRWMLERGDFRAEWDPAARRGRIRQSPNPYSLDTVLRIVHTLRWRIAPVLWCLTPSLDDGMLHHK